MHPKSEILMITLSTNELLNVPSEIDKGELFQFYTSLTQKMLLLSETGVTTRTYQHWKTFDIVPQSDEENADTKREWVKLNFSDYLWVKTINTLRKFGYPFEHIKIAKDTLFDENVIHNFKAENVANPELFNSLLEFQLKDKLSKEMKDALKELISDKDIMTRLMDNILKQSNLWKGHIFMAIQNKNTEVGIAFFEDGTCFPFQWNILLDFPILEFKDAFEKIIRKPHIYISLTKYIIDFIADEEKIDYTIKLSLLNKQDEEILNKVRGNEYKKITINYDSNTGTKIIKTEKDKKIKKENVTDFIKEALFNPYSKTTFTTTKKGDLIVNVEQTKKI